MIRTHEAGSLRSADAGTTVTLAGWVARRRDHGGVIFVDLRDGSGIVQVVFREELEAAHALRNEFCVKVTGTVGRRPEGNDNPELPTGEIEVTADELVILSEAAPLPIPVDDNIEAGDDIRLRYRYLDLRRSGPHRNLKLRSNANKIARARPRRARLQRDRDADAHPVDAGGRARFPRAGAFATRHVVRASPEPAALQAAADGGRHGALLPDRALLPRRRLPGRPPARVHAARHRDVLHHARRHHRARRGDRRRAVGRAGRLRAAPRRCPASPGPRRWSATAPTSPTFVTASS